VLLSGEFVSHRLQVGQTPLSHDELLSEDDEKEENNFSGLSAPHFGQEISASLESSIHLLILNRKLVYPDFVKLKTQPRLRKSS
jgi:hypothetical protein